MKLGIVIYSLFHINAYNFLYLKLNCNTRMKSKYRVNY